MNRYAQGGDLTQFNEGGLHSQNPLGGVPIGNNNSVEQGETKQDNFIYSNRIFLDSNIISQYNLPKSLIGKSVADATKMIDDKFKGRNDKISQSTKNGMLSKIAEAQEAMKPQEPEMEQQGYSQESMEQSQMAYGGYKQYDSQFEDSVGQAVYTGADMIAPGTGQLMKMGDQLGESLGNAIGGSRGESIGGFVGPTGGIKGLVSAVKNNNINDIPLFGVFGGQTTKQKLATENANNFAVNTNNQFSDKYAYGGQIDPPIENKETWNTKKIVKYQSGVTSGKNGDSGFYLYSKNQTEPGFNVNRDREFVNQENMMDLQRTPQWKEYQQSLQIKKSQPIVQLALGGKMNQMGDGGITGYGADGRWIKPPTADYDTNVIKNVHDAIGITSDMKGYGKEWGKKSNQAYYNNILKSDPSYGNKYKGVNLTKSQILEPFPESAQKRLGLTPEGYKFTPETPVFPQKEDPIITPTQTKAGFEAYADAKQITDNKTSKTSFGKTINDNLGNLARYAPIAANALQLAMLKKPQGERLDRLSNRYKSEYVDEAALQNIANQTMNNSVNAIGQSGASQGQLRASIIGSQLQRTKAISDAYSQAAAQNRATNDRVQTFNLGVDSTNLQQSNTEKDINARDQAAYRNAKREYITGIGEGIGGIGDEQAYKKIAKNTTGYTWDGTYVKTPDGNIVTNPTTGKPMTQEELKQSRASKDKKALGGYLIKNRVK